MSEIKSALNKPTTSGSTATNTNAAAAGGKAIAVALDYRGPHYDQSVQFLVDIFGAEAHKVGYAVKSAAETVYIFLADPSKLGDIETGIGNSPHVKLFGPQVDGKPGDEIEHYYLREPTAEELEAANRVAGQLPTLAPIARK